MRKVFLRIILSIALIFSTIPANSAVSAQTGSSVEDYTTTAYAPWWSLYHLTSPDAVNASIKGGEGGQMIWAMDVSPSNPQKLLYSTDTSGIWRSDDAGATWSISTTGLKTVGTVDIAYDPDDSNVAYVASSLHDAGTYGHVNDNVGIYKTTDGGATWNQVLKCNFYRLRTNKIIKFGPADGQGHRAIYVGTHSTGVYKSDDDGVNWTNLGCAGDEITDLYVDSGRIIEVSLQSGVVVSTDGGSHWTPMNNGLPGTRITSLAVNPADTSNWFVVVNNNRTIYKTIDAGANWVPAGTLTDLLDGMPQKLLFSGLNGDSNPVLYLTLNQNSDTLRYSTDLGETFQTPVFDNSIALRKDQTGYWAESTTVDPSNPWTVWTSLDGVIYKSTSTGTINLSPSTGGVSGMRVYKLLFDDSGNITYMAVLDHGVVKVVPGYDTDYPPVVHLNNLLRYQGQWSTHSIAADPSNSRHLFAKVGNWGDNLILEESNDGGTTWTQIEGTGGSYGGLLEYHPQNSQVIYAGMLRSTDNGITWTTLSKAISAVSPINGDIVYSQQGNRIYKSTDKGDTWTALKPTIAGQQKLTADWLTSDRLWVGTFNNGMYRIDGDKATHIGRDQLQPSLNGNYGIFNIAQDPNNPFHYVAGGCDNTAMGPGAGLFESFDGGYTWSLVPDIPGMKDIWSMQFNNTKPLVYICTSDGLLVYDWSKRSDITIPDSVTPTAISEYSEDFNDNKAQGWVLSSGFSVDQQYLHSEDFNQDQTAIYDWQTASTPFKYKVDLVTDEGDNSSRIKIIFNYQDNSNYHYLDLGGGATPTINLKKVALGAESTIAASVVSYSFMNDWSTVEIRCGKDGFINVDVTRGGETEQLFTDVIDTTFSSGKLGVGTQSCGSVSFDNINVIKESTPVLPISTYNEDFNDNVAQDWECTSGFQVDRGFMYNNDYNGVQTAIYSTGIATVSYIYKLDMFTYAGDNGNRMKIIFNYQDEENYYYLDLGGGATPAVNLKKVVLGSESTIAVSAASYNFMNEWSTVKIRCGRGGLINVDVTRNGSTTHLFSEVTDATFASGKIGVGTRSCNIVVDNILVDATV